MKKSSVLPKMYSVSDLQRDYPAILRDAQRSGDPIYLLKQNEPEGVLLSVEKYKSLLDRIYQLEMGQALESIRVSEEEYKAGKLKKYTSMEDLLNDE